MPQLSLSALRKSTLAKRSNCAALRTSMNPAATTASGPVPACYTSPRPTCPGSSAACGPASNRAVLSTSASSTAKANAALGSVTSPMRPKRGFAIGSRACRSWKRWSAGSHVTSGQSAARNGSMDYCGAKPCQPGASSPASRSTRCYRSSATRSPERTRSTLRCLSCRRAACACCCPTSMTRSPARLRSRDRRHGSAFSPATISTSPIQRHCAC